MSQKQDKQRIYNSLEWHRLREAKLQINPLCERCQEQGYIVSATCVHHIVPIETARNFEEMQRLAFCAITGLQSLCYQCHSDIHKAMRSRSREGHKRASQAALDRWINRHSKEKPSGPHLSVPNFLILNPVFTVNPFSMKHRKLKRIDSSVKW